MAGIRFVEQVEGCVRLAQQFTALSEKQMTLLADKTETNRAPGSLLQNDAAIREPFQPLRCLTIDWPLPSAFARWIRAGVICR